MSTEPAAAIREYLRYDRDTGLFVWIKRPGPHARQRAGDIAGIKRPRGYVQVKFQGRLYLAHRLAWWFVHGEWPSQTIDHRNRSKGDNRIDNLRLATGTENQGNCGPQERNASGFKGVSFEARRGKWVAYIGKKGLGRFNTPAEAARAYDAAALQHFGEFAWLNFEPRA